MRHLRATGAVAPLLALAACASPASGAAPQAAAAPPAAQAVSAHAVSAAHPLDDGTSCTGPGYRVELPAGWSTNDAGVLPACSWFGPGEVVVPEASDVRTAPVTLQVVDAPLAEAAVPMPDEVGRTELVVGGREAVRIEQVTTLGLYPEGTRITTWAVDLGGRTLLADAVELPRGDHQRAVAALDAMLEGLQTTAG